VRGNCLNYGKVDSGPRSFRGISGKIGTKIRIELFQMLRKSGGTVILPGPGSGRLSPPNKALQIKLNARFTKASRRIDRGSAKQYKEKRSDFIAALGDAGR
jgi:hypothetical protein